MLKEAYVLSEKKVQGQTYCCETTAPRLVCLTQKPMLLVYYTIPHSIDCAGVVQFCLGSSVQALVILVNPSDTWSHR